MLLSIVTWVNDKSRLSLPIFAIFVLLSGLALGCGGGGKTAQNNTLTVVAPSNLTYPQPTITATVGKAIIADIPAVTGTVDSYTVSPTLPAGLSLNSLTGAISGTPTAVAVQATYTVVARNSAGSTSAMIQVTVNAAVVAPSNLAYPQATILANVGTPITTDIPTVSGTVAFYTISPPLPSGLSLNSSTGAISGTPTAVSASTTYTITASNSVGNSTANVTIAVNPAASVLLDLGHAVQIGFLRFTNSRVLSQDISHWVLWDYVAGTKLVQGDQGARLPLDMAGNTVVIGLPNGLEVRASSDGSILSTIASSTSWWKLATDGSYICAGSPTGLTVWTPTGQVLVSKSGDYSAANAFAAPNQVQIALGAAGQNVIETVSTTNGSSSLGPAFSGQFNSWFLDGGRFLTNVSNTVWTYSNATVQQALVPLPTVQNLTGQGNWIWTYESNLPGYAFDIYPVGSTTPTASYALNADTLVIPSGTTVAVLPYGAPSASVIDLSGSSPSMTAYALPFAYTTSFGASSSSQWIIGNTHGVLLDGASLGTSPRYLGFGAAWSIAGATGRVAIATAKGTIFYLDPSTTTIEGTIAFSSSKLELSSDGTVLAAAADENDFQYETDRTLKVFSLPTGTLINSWTYAFQNQAPLTPFLVDFSLSGSGTVIGQALEALTNPLSYSRQVTATTGGSTIWSDTPPGFAPIQLSPDGTLIAVSQAPPTVNSATNVYKNGTLTTAVPGWAVGWIDNGRLLVNNYVQTIGSFSMFSGCAIYDPTGVNLAQPALPELLAFQTVTSDSIYSPKKNAIFSLTTGALIWTSVEPSLGVGAVSGSHIVFASGSRVLSEGY
jgi:putative Ig domain-containing protein